MESMNLKEVSALNKYGLGASPMYEVHCIKRGICFIITEKVMPTEKKNTWMMLIYRFPEK